MIVTLGFCQKDAAAARDMLLWCEQLGGCKKFDALLVTDPSTQWSECVATMEQAGKVFRAVNFATTEQSVMGWPHGANALFKTAAEWAQKEKHPFLWLESDAIPLRPGWLHALHTEYNRVGNPFMGRVYPTRDATLPPKVMSGIAIYPVSTIDLFRPVWRDAVPWDASTASVALASCTNTGLIQWFWGHPNKAPTFVRAKGRGTPENAFTIDKLEPTAVLFHRNKDGTLIERLREVAGFTVPDNFHVVFGFYKHDAENALNLMRWVADIGTPKTHDLLLWYEAATDHNIVAQITKAAALSFNQVMHGSYREPRLGANGAWFTAAKHMDSIRRPWLWLEPDAIPIGRHWLCALQTRYNRCGKPFMGPVVPIMGHMNGTAVYPWNTARSCPKTMAVITSSRERVAWDYVMKSEVAHLYHDCSDLYQHAWAEVDGKLIPFGGDNPPSFPTRDSLKRLLPEAVIFHRCKDHSLIERLREVQNRL